MKILGKNRKFIFLPLLCILTLSLGWYSVVPVFAGEFTETDTGSSVTAPPAGDPGDPPSIDQGDPPTGDPSDLPSIDQGTLPDLSGDSDSSVENYTVVLLSLIHI